MRFALLFALAATCFARTHYVTVAGIGGEQDYEQRFTQWAKDIEKILKGSGAEDSDIQVIVSADATRKRLEEAVVRAAGSAKADEPFVLMLIGHGTYDGADYKFNLKGPDISGIELAALCDRVPSTRQLVVNMTSSSGGAIASLQKPNRAVISATKSGGEKNATIFARYWVEALRDAAADTDKNETVTALEAFVYAEKKTSGFYDTQKRLATEHAVLEDTGKGDGVRAPSTENGQGRMASIFPLLRIGSAQRAAAQPHKKALLERKERIEQRIDQLKYDKAALPSDQYKKQLSALLLELAQVQEEIDQ